MKCFHKIFLKYFGFSLFFLWFCSLQHRLVHGKIQNTLFHGLPVRVLSFVSKDSRFNSSSVVKIANSASRGFARKAGPLNNSSSTELRRLSWVNYSVSAGMEQYGFKRIISTLIKKQIIYYIRPSEMEGNCNVLYLFLSGQIGNFLLLICIFRNHLNPNEVLCLCSICQG